MSLDPKHDIQLGPDGRLRHLLTTEGLPAETIRHILDTADQFVSVSERDVKKVPLLRGRSIFNELFDFGRPAAVRLAVLVDRDGREMPFAADYCGARVALAPGERLALANDGRLAFSVERRAK